MLNLRLVKQVSDLKVSKNLKVKSFVRSGFYGQNRVVVVTPQYLTPNPLTVPSKHQD